MTFCTSRSLLERNDSVMTLHNQPQRRKDALFSVFLMRDIKLLCRQPWIEDNEGPRWEFKWGRKGSLCEKQQEAAAPVFIQISAHFAKLEIFLTSQQSTPRMIQWKDYIVGRTEAIFQFLSTFFSRSQSICSYSLKSGKLCLFSKN